MKKKEGSGKLLNRLTLSARKKEGGVTLLEGGERGSVIAAEF